LKDEEIVSEQNIQDLMRQGIEARREGQKEEARELFKQVVEIDADNEKGWFWLASVAESDEERRDALQKVLALNPNNERAEAELEKVRARLGETPDSREVIPGINQRQLLMFGGGGAVVIILLVLLLIVVTSSRNAQIASEQAAATGTYSVFTAVAAAATNDAINATGTQAAVLALTPQPTSTFQRAPLPATFTPQPSATALVTPTPLPQPSGMEGRIYGWSGQDVNKTGYLSVGYFPVNGGGQFMPVPEMVGRDPIPSPDGQNIVFTQYFATTFDFGIGHVSLSGTDPVVLTQNQKVFKTQMPSYCTASNMIAFVGLSTAERDITFGDQNVQPAYQVFTLNLDTSVLSRLTNDKATYTYPAFSNDCSKIAVVRNDNGQGADLVLINTSDNSQTAITNDLGSFTESRPSWSPDGVQLIYSAYPSTDPNNSDIIVRSADGSGTPLVPIRDPSNDIFPVFSPDGHDIAFTSNRDGYYDIFILDQDNGTLSQLTFSPDEDYPTAWTP
jgi:Tol biopolymer transport system component/type II secretory pathway pseudopilin PulG